MTVAVVGLGNLGGGIARRLVDQGVTVLVSDSDPTAAAAFGDAARHSPAEAVAGAAVATVVVRTDEQAVAVIAGPGGILEGAGPELVVVLHSTVAPSTVEHLVGVCGAAGVELLDAGISGGPERAATGTLVTVVGGSAAALERARPTLAVYCSDVIGCGPSGAGMAAKLARNLAQYGVWCALFESMELAAGAGVDLDVYATYVRASGLPSNHDVALGRGSVDPVPTAGDPDAAARLRWAVDLGHKDLDDAFELAERQGLDVPIGHIARERYARMMGLEG